MKSNNNNKFKTICFQFTQKTKKFKNKLKKSFKNKNLIRQKYL